MEYETGTGDDTGQADWLDADGPESQARESLKDFKCTEVVLGLPFRDPLVARTGQKVRPEGGPVGGCVITRKGWARA